MKRVILVVGTLTLLAQGVLWWRSGQPTLPHGPEMDAVLPSIMVQLIDASDDPIPLSDLIEAKQPCTLIVLASRDCIWCQRMRHTWAEEYRTWVDEAGIEGRIQAVWVMAEGVSAAQQFFDGYDFAGIQQVAVASNLGEAWRRLGVFATPITYLTDARGHLKLGILGDRIPEVEVGTNTCGT